MSAYCLNSYKYTKANNLINMLKIEKYKWEDSFSR